MKRTIKKAIAVALISVLALTLAPFSQAASRTGAAVIAAPGSRFLLQVFGSNGQGGQDTSQYFSIFESVTVGDDSIAEVIVGEDGKYYIHFLQPGVTTYTVTLPNGDTITGTLISPSDSEWWGSDSRGYADSGPTATSTTASDVNYVVLPMGAVDFREIRLFDFDNANFNPDDYTYAFDGDALGCTFDATYFVFHAGTTPGVVTIKATAKNPPHTVFTIKIRVRMPIATIPPGSSLDFAAFFGSGGPLANAAAYYWDCDPAMGSFTTAGVFVAGQTPGLVIISATNLTDLHEFYRWAVEIAPGPSTPLIEPKSVKINSVATTTVRKGKTLQMSVTLTPANATTTISVSSSNAAAMTAAVNGDLSFVVTGVKAGSSARITVMTANGKSYSITVTVSA